MKKIIYLITSSFFLFSLQSGCSQEDSIKTFTFINNTDNVKVLYEGFIHSGDTIKHGMYKSFYPDGSLKSEGKFVNDNPIEYHKEWYDNGQLKSKLFYLGNLHYMGYHYYKNGHLMREANYNNGAYYGLFKEYYPNEKIYRYSCFDFGQKGVYSMEFDSLGRILLDEGVVFSPEFRTNYPLDSIKLDSIFDLRITVAEPPSTKTIIVIEETLEDGKIIESQEYPIQGYTVFYKKKFESAGKHTLLIKGKIVDTSNGQLRKENVSIVDLNIIE
ncbi:MAG: hypothetical protein AAF901_13910 [Bacteroidota bacterium]